MRRALVASIVLLTSGCHGGGTPITFTETRSFPGAAGKVVRVSLGSLDLEVRTAETDTIGVEVALEARSSAPGAATRWVETHRPAYSDGPSKLEIEVPERRKGTFLVGFFRSHGTVRLTVPSACRLEVETTSGDVALDGEVPLDGAVRVATASGDLEVRGGAREIVVRTASGDVNIGGEGLDRLEAETASGDVVLRSGARQVIVDTASGDVDLLDLTANLSVHTASGDVSAAWSAPPSGSRIDVKTTSGDVELRLPAASAVAGSARTTTGRLESDWTGSWGKRNRSLQLAAAPTAAMLALRTTSGNIVLRHADDSDREAVEEAGDTAPPPPAEAPQPRKLSEPTEQSR